ncbi:MAG: MarR family transcriptional regulator [Clostridia bacterium]|nr:MarR family transcriptional regulator [Clostridia bacterium]
MPIPFMRRLNIISRCQNLFRAKHSQALPCPCHHTFLFAVCCAPGRSQEEIARDVCLNKSTVTRALTELEQQGYVTRIPNQNDKRQMLIFPTKKAEETLPQVRALAQSFNEAVLKGIEDTELSAFLNVLLRIEENARKLAYQTKEDTP